MLRTNLQEGILNFIIQIRHQNVRDDEQHVCNHSQHTAGQRPDPIAGDASHPSKGLSSGHHLVSHISLKILQTKIPVIYGAGLPDSFSCHVSIKEPCVHNICLDLLSVLHSQNFRALVVNPKGLLIFFLSLGKA